MWTVFKHTIKESIHRRMAVVLLTVACLFGGVMIGTSRFSPGPKDSVQIAFLNQPPMDAVQFVLNIETSLLAITTGLLFLVAMFAMAPLLVTYVEKGMAELLFAKGVARWEVFLGRVMGAFALFVAAMVMMDIFPALYFWVRAGITLRYFTVSVLLLAASYLSMLCLMALVSAFQPSVASVVTIGFIDLIISSILLNRSILQRFFQNEFLHKGMDVLYYVFPKHEELSRMAASYLNLGHVPSWTPLWSTLGFCVGALMIACWKMSRKSF